MFSKQSLPTTRFLNNNYKFNRQYVKEFLDQEEALADKYEAEEDMPRGDAQAVAEADMKRMYGKTAGEALAELPL